MASHTVIPRRSLDLAVAALSLVLCLSAGEGFAQQTDSRDKHTRAHFNALDRHERETLKRAFGQHVRVFNSATDLVAFPRHQLYRAAFQNVLTDPDLALQFSRDDWEVIIALPSHADGRFMKKARRSIAQACSLFDKGAPGNDVAARAAIERYVRGSRQIDNMFNTHYSNVMRQLSAPGRRLVAEQLESLGSDGSMVYSEIDFMALGFSHPGFVAAFLQDSCRNAAGAELLASQEPRLLRDEMAHSLATGALQIYSPD